MKYYVYIYLDPRYVGRYCYDKVTLFYKPFYIGKGSGDRWQIHLRESHLKLGQNPKKDNLIYKLQREFKLREYVIILPCISEEESFNMEIQLISEIGFDNLTNLVRGGIGSSGLKHSEEFKKRIKEINKHPKPEGFGERVSKTKRGIPLSEEHKQALRGRTFSEEHRKKLSLAKRIAYGKDD